MMKGLARLCMAALFVLLLTACSSNSGDNKQSTGTIPKPAGPPSTVVVSSAPDGGSYTIFATVTDSSGKLVDDGTPVTFSVNNANDDLSPTETTTTGGVAQTFYTPSDSTSQADITAATDNGKSDSLTIKIVGPPANITVTTALPPNSVLEPGDTVVVTAFVTDQNGNTVDDGTTIFWTVDSSGASINDSSTTEDDVSTTLSGRATANFNAGTARGAVKVQALSKVDITTGNRVQGSTEVVVSTGEAESISLLSVIPTSIGVRATGQTEFSTITFGVKDSGNNPVPDGTQIDFEVVPPLGGARLLADSAFTVDGVATATLQAGTISGTVSVIASFTNTVGQVTSTEGRIAIVSGPPDSRHFSMSQSLFNQAGYRFEGLRNNFNAILADRYGNVVKDGTPVSFVSDCGVVGVNEVGETLEPFTTTTSLGKATSQFHTADPLKEICTVLAFSPGRESFDDDDGDGEHDPGETCYGVSEPLIDSNESTYWETGEIYFDINGNGEWDRFDDPDMAECGEAMLWNSRQLMMSDHLGPLDLSLYDPDTGLCVPFDPTAGSIFDIQIGNSQAFCYTLADVNGNRIVSGTNVAVTTDCTDAKISGGTLAFTTADGIGPGTVNTFVLSASIEEDAEPEQCAVEISLTPPSSPDTNPETVDQGRNFDANIKTSFIGIVNSQPIDDVPPYVVFTIPSNGQTNVGANAEINITFSKAMDPLTVTPATISLTGPVDYDDDGVVDVPNGNIELGDPTAFTGFAKFTVAPADTLLSGVHTVTISGNVRDQVTPIPNAMGSDYVFTFTVNAPPVAPPAP